MQKISEKKTETCHAEDVVNTQNTHEGHNAVSTQPNNTAYVKRDNLMSKVLERTNLKNALKRVETNKGAPGVDSMSTKELRGYLKETWTTRKVQLEDGSYNPTAIRKVDIPKLNGGTRKLGIPTVFDRFIQQAILQVLTPIFDPHFVNQSYGFRPNKSAHQAVKQAQEYVKDGYEIVVDIDLEKFFDTVNHDILMGKLYERIADKTLLKLIRKYLKAGVMINGCCMVQEQGTPQGGPLSPLLSNILLDDLDKELIKRGHNFTRYADDCNIHVKTERAGARVFASISSFIEEKLRLKVNKEKSAVDVSWKRKSLGFKIRSDNIYLAEQTVKRLKIRIKQLTRGNWSISMEERIRKLNEYLTGWLGYYGIAKITYEFKAIDKWMRRRLRMVLLKQWKLCKTKLRELKLLGISDEWAAQIAFSRKKYWRLSNTPQVNKALGLAYWYKQGLMSLQEQYRAKWNAV